MKSVWQQRTETEERSGLRHSISVDVAVVGGGLAGLLTACLLAKEGVDVVVLEASRIGSGQTGKSTGKVTSQHGLCYTRLIKSFGSEWARLYAKANEAAISELEAIVDFLASDCNFKRLPAFLYTNVNENTALEEACAARLLGIPSQYVHKTDLPFEVKAALRFDNQAQVDPMRLVADLSKGLPVYENTRVLKIRGTTCVTELGDVRAKRVVVATHYPMVDKQGMLYARIHQERAYVIALKNTPALNGIYYGIDYDGLSMRNFFENGILLTGGKHRTGENSTGGKYELLRNAAKKFFPQSEEITHWSAQDCMTVDNIPYIGVYGDGRFIMTGFNKWGMSSSMVAARIVTDILTRGGSPFEEIFSPQRLRLGCSAKPLANEISHSVKGIGRRFFAPARGIVNNLPCGHGGIVEFNAGDGLEKLGVYKDEEGAVYAVSPQCPHMGCQLEWNPDELSWDCPCHGSRFDYMGNLLDNPAKEDLERCE